MSHACHCFWKCYTTFTFLLTFDKVRNPLRLPRETTSERPKVLRTPQFFESFDFEMCFAPQRCASQLPKVLRHWCALNILTWKCASRHHGVQLFISHLATWLRTRRFSEPTLRPSGATNHWKNSVSRLCYLFARLHLLSSHSSSSLIFFLLLFLFSDSSHLCFSICPYCRKFDF